MTFTFDSTALAPAKGLPQDRFHGVYGDFMVLFSRLPGEGLSRFFPRCVPSSSSSSFSSSSSKSLSARCRQQWALLDLNHERQISVGTGGTSTASSRSQWALDLSSERQISVGTPGPQPDARENVR